MFFSKSYIISAVLALFLTGTVICQTDSTNPGKNTEPADSKVTRGTDPPVESVDPADRTDERYLIGYEDVLTVSVFKHPELSQTVSVGRDGTILLPRIDNPVVAVCKTERELSSLIAALYQSFLRAPFVSVRAVEQRSQPFAVMGAVTKPGSYYMNRRVRLLELIAIAGGPDYERSGSRVRVAKVGNFSGCKGDDDGESIAEFYTYSLPEVMKGVQNPIMEPGDVVSLLEAEEAYVVGDVTEPTVIQLKEPITLSQAIAKAGGMGGEAKSSKVVIQRREPGSRVKTELVFDMKEIRAQKVPDPFLQANDIVEVPTDNKKVIRNGILKAITGGLGNIFYRFPL